MRETTSEICSESERDSLMASPSSFISCLSCGSTVPPCQKSTYQHPASGPPRTHFQVFRFNRSRAILRCIVLQPQRFQTRGQSCLSVCIQSRKRSFRRPEVAAKEIQGFLGGERKSHLHFPSSATDLRSSTPQPLPYCPFVPPKNRRRNYSRRWHQFSCGTKCFAYKTLRGPVGHRDQSVRLADAKQFRRDALGPWGKHRPEHTQHNVE